MNTQIAVIIGLAVLVIMLFAAGYYMYSRIGQAIEYDDSRPDLNITTTTFPMAPAPTISLTKATVQTNLGEFTMELYPNDAPKTVANFVKLVQDKFYDGLIFHRVVRGFVIQGGDPNCTPARSQGSCGSGGPGYQFEDELNPATASYQVGYTKGVVAMANAGPNTNGSQFFVMLQDNPLPHSYSIFGKVISGQDVVDAIGLVQVSSGDRPITPVAIDRIILR